MCPIAPNALWALDFQFDTTVDGRTLKLLNVVDEFTRECPAIVVDRTSTPTRSSRPSTASRANAARPAFVRFDNGPEFIARAVADWCRFNGVDTVFIDPGSPWQNAWIECFNGRLRDEFLNGWHFDNLLEAQVLIEDWRIDYNDNRPHSAHGDLTPSEFARSMDHPKPTSTRITAGPLNGDPSPAPYPPEFRAEAIRLVRSGDRSVSEIAKDLGVSAQSLRNWLRQADLDEGHRHDGSDDRGPGRADPVASREPGVARGTRDPEKSSGLLRQGDSDPTR